MAFTPIIDGTDWQALSFLNQLRSAMDERSRILGESAYAPTAEGDDIQSVEYWYSIQAWLEVNCTQFVNHTLTASVTKFTLATWREAAGIEASGFRRAQVWNPDPVAPDWEVDPTYLSNGKMEEGDIIGPWIFDDLQAGFDALRWTTDDSSSAYGGSYKNMVRSQNKAACNTDRTNAINQWNGMSWTSGGGYYLATARGNKYKSIINDDYTFWYAARFSSQWVQSGISTYRPHEALVYLKPKQYGVHIFTDIDHLGMIEGSLWLLDTLAEATTAARISREIGKGGYFEDCPIEASPLTCAEIPDPAPRESSDVKEGIECTNQSWWIFKWNFVNVKP